MQKKNEVEKFKYYSLRPFIESREYQERLMLIQGCVIEEIFELELKTYSDPVLKLLVKNE